VLDRRLGGDKRRAQMLCEVSGMMKLWVYTGMSDHVAVSSYKSLGFEILGTAGKWAHGRTMDDTDIVMRRML
jgi:hypothetical protein